jgi:protein-L-isoaspartate(D-aspartate) O-methyltransferase
MYGINNTLFYESLFSSPGSVAGVTYLAAERIDLALNGDVCGGLIMKALDEAFRAMPRSNFLPSVSRSGAALDIPLDIGHGQTNSQPTTVRMMLGWLDAQPGDTVLDVGSGSGWTTALLSYLVGSAGMVHAVERIPELVKFGRENCARLGLSNVRFHRAGPVFGLPDYAPYDRILVSAAAEEVPQALLEQLKTGGTLVIPVRYDVHVIRKHAKGRIEDDIHAGFVFVPLL